MNPDDPALRAELREVAVAVATEAAELLADRLDDIRTSVSTKTTGTDMVTEVDRASEALIVERLTELRPDDGLLGEEGSDHPGTSGIRWVFDPLDGTTNYLYRFPGFNVSIAAEIDGIAVAGAVVDVLRREVFSAALDGGATCNGVPVIRTGAPPLHQALVATGFGYQPDRRKGQAEVLARLIDQIRDIRRMGAAAVDLCSVAMGRVDAYFERGLAHWDWAAGALIAREAGLVVIDLDGEPPGPHFLLAAPPSLLRPLRDLLIASGSRDVP